MASTGILTGCAGAQGDGESRTSAASRSFQGVDRTPESAGQSNLNDGTDNGEAEDVSNESDRASESPTQEQRTEDSKPEQENDTDSVPAEELLSLQLAALEANLDRSCGRCHGADLYRGYAAAGITYIADIQALIDVGFLIPGNSRGSRLIQLMRNGSMPPPNSGATPFSEEELEALADFIDQPVM